MRKKIGTFGVDSGQVLIIDPCYIKYHKALHNADNWDEFCKLRDLSKSVQEMYLGIVSSTYHDGSHSVYAHYDKNGKITKLEVLL